jgi:hypothetical protein
MNEENQVIQEILYSEEMKSFGNHERDGRTEKHGETKATEKSSKQFQALSLTPWER